MESSRKALIKANASSIRIAGNLVFDTIVVISRTATKNIKLGAEAGNMLEMLAGKWAANATAMEDTKYEGLFNLFTKISNLRDICKNIFWGSMFNDLLDGGY